MSGTMPLSEFLAQFAGKGNLKPQTYWIKNYSGAIPLDYIGRFENLAEDFKTICRAMQIPEIPLPHKIKGTGEDYRESYDADSIEIIANVYKEEIEIFGYTFEA